MFSTIEYVLLPMLTSIQLFELSVLHGFYLSDIYVKLLKCFTHRLSQKKDY